MIIETPHGLHQTSARAQKLSPFTADFSHNMAKETSIQMSYFATHPESELGNSVGSGECVAYVRKVSGAPSTGTWRQGKKVRGYSLLSEGTAIATFDAAGKYPNMHGGSSHAAIYISQSAAGIRVWDQWLGQPVHTRTIRFRGGASGVRPVNDGDAFFVIE